MFPLAKQRGGAPAAARSGMGSALQERAPGLKDGVDRLVGAIVKGLQTMAGTTTTIEGVMAGAAMETPRDVVAGHPAEAVAGLVECAALGCKLVVTLNGRLVHSIVELLAGGNGTEPPPEAARPATGIDQQFAMILVTLAAAGICSEWADFGFGTARAARIDGPLTADILGARVTEVAVVRVTLGAFGQHGTLRVVLPPAALDRFRRTEVDADGDDPSWRTHLQRELGRAAVSLDAYLDARPIALSSLAALQVGQVLALPAEARARVSLVKEGRTLYRGEIGQDDGRYSLRVDEIVADPTVAQDVARNSPLAFPRA